MCREGLRIAGRKNGSGAKGVDYRRKSSGRYTESFYLLPACGGYAGVKGLSRSEVARRTNGSVKGSGAFYNTLYSWLTVDADDSCTRASQQPGCFTVCCVRTRRHRETYRLPKYPTCQIMAPCTCGITARFSPVTENEEWREDNGKQTYSVVVHWPAPHSASTTEHTSARR